MKALAALLGGVAAAAGIAAYLRVLRPRQLRWGATDADVARAMPGDDIVARPTFNATRAISIEALPAEIWPWIVQMGLGRAGWYSYDWIDNLGRKSARTVLPDYQFPQPGDIVPVSPNGKSGFWVKSLERDRSIVWWDKKGRASWAWAIHPDGEQSSRLVTRVRIRYAWTSPVIVFHLLLDAGDIVMMRKCLRGIKERAEAAAAQRRNGIQLIEDLIAGALHSA